MSKTTLPDLYKKRKDGKLHKWKIWVDGDAIYKQDHLVGGKQKDPTFKTCIGTNIGRSNEKTPETQAKNEAERTWARMLDKGYSPDPSDQKGNILFRKVMQAKSQSGFQNHDIMKKANQQDIGTGNISRDRRLFPMLAMEWSKKKKKISLNKGAYIQPKIDGVRCLARLEKGKALLTSRTGKNFPHFQHIKQDLEIILQESPNVILDGELYAHSIAMDGEELDKTERWELISGMCSIARKKPHEHEKLISLYVFDVYDVDGKFTQEERFQALDELFKVWKKKKMIHSNSVIRLQTEIVNSEEEIMDKHEVYIQDSYEGVMIRDRDAKYLPGPTKRSEYLLKYKSFDTDEFSIVDAKEGSGTEKGCVIWICVTKDGKKFSCRPQGNKSKRQQWWDNYTSFLGKDLTIRYQGKDPTRGIPRFPVGIDIDRFSKE